MCYGITPDWYRNGELLDETGYATDLITDDAVRYISQRNGSKPFFLFLPYNAPHFGKGWNDGQNEPVNILQPHPRDLKRVQFIKDPTRRKYAAKVVALDDGIGRVLKALEFNGMREDTIVIFMADNGGKATLFEGGLRVPCLVRWPGVIKPGSVSNEITWALDWFPTFCALSNTSTASLTLDGLDISPLLRGDKFNATRELFWELAGHVELDRGHWLAMRKGALKYISSPDDGERLFDIINDPSESRDLSDVQSQPLEKLRIRAEELRKHYRYPKSP